MSTIFRNQYIYYGLLLITNQFIYLMGSSIGNYYSLHFHTNTFILTHFIGRQDNELYKYNFSNLSTMKYQAITIRNTHLYFIISMLLFSLRKITTVKKITIFFSYYSDITQFIIIYYIVQHYYLCFITVLYEKKLWDLRKYFKLRD